MHDKAFLNRLRSKNLLLFFLLSTKKFLTRGGGNVIIKHKQKGGMAVENKFRNLFTRGHNNDNPSQEVEKEEIVIDSIDEKEEPVMEVVDSEVQQVTEETINQSQDNSIVESNVYYDADSEIKFQRVNFDDPNSITNYGQDIIREYNDTMNKLNTLSNIKDVNPVAFSNMVNDLSEFNDFEDDNEKSTIPRLLPEKGALKPFAKFINKGKEIKAETENYSDKDLLEKYNKNIDDLAEAVEKEKNNTLASIELDKESAKKSMPYINALDLAIKVGEQDLNDYIKNVYDVTKVEYEKTSSIVLESKLKLIDQKIDIFSKTLNVLRNQLTMMQASYFDKQLRQKPSQEMVISYQMYLNSSINTLRDQARSIVANKRLKEKQEKFQLLTDKTNETIRNNSKTALGNIKRAQEISDRGNIDQETFEELKNNAQAGIDLIKQGRENIKEKNEKDKEFISEMLNSFTSYTEELKSIYDETTFDTDTFTSNQYQDKDQDNKKGRSFFPFGRLGKK